MPHHYVVIVAGSLNFFASSEYWNNYQSVYYGFYYKRLALNTN